MVPAAATPYPSNISVTGLSGVVSKITVTISSISHSYPADIDMLLVSPDGKQVMIWSDAGGAGALVNYTMVFDDAGTILPEFGLRDGSTYHPWNYYNDSQFPAPAPAMGFAVLDAFSGDIPRLSTYNGINPNGTWSLYVVDDADGQGGAIAGGWSISVTTVPGAPIVKNAAPSAISTTGATLNGTVTPNGEPTSYHFEYGPTDSYGSSTASTSAGSGTTPVAVSAPVTGLTAKSDYHFRLVASNGTGTTNGPDQTLTTPPEPPVVATGAATAITQTGATLNGTVNANGVATTYRFEYGTTALYGSVTSATPAGSGTSAAPVTADLAGLTAGTTYHVRLIATNAGGTSNGADQTFVTASPPPTPPPAPGPDPTGTTPAPAPDPTSTTPGPGPSTGTPAATEPLVATLNAAPTQRKQVRFTITLSRPARVAATLRDARGRSYGSLRSRPLAAGRHTLTIRFSTSARRLLARLRGVTATLKVTAIPDGGGAVTQSRTVTLRR